MKVRETTEGGHEFQCAACREWVEFNGRLPENTTITVCLKDECQKKYSVRKWDTKPEEETISKKPDYDFRDVIKMQGKVTIELVPVQRAENGRT